MILLLASLLTIIRLKSTKTPNQVSKNTVSLKDKDVDILRDTALNLENIDLSASYQLMRIASENRPSGTYIRQKLGEYQDLLDGNSAQEGSPKTHQYLTSPCLVLKLKPAGFGDMLQQINKFLWVCDYYEYKPPLFFFSGPNDRNEISVDEFFDALNINDANIRARYFNHQNAISLTEFMNHSQEGTLSKLAGNHLIFDAASYSIDYPPGISDNFNKTHKSLSQISRDSDLFRRVKTRRERQGRKVRVCLHLRRGDVAQVSVATVRHLIKDNIGSDMILHTEGIFHPEEFEEKVSHINRRRFRSIETHQARLEKILETIDEPYELVFLTDGMSKLAANLKLNNAQIFKDPDVSEATIEEALEQEFMAFAKNFDVILSGERNTFWSSVEEGVSSDIIVSRSPGFLRRIALVLDLETKIYNVY